ncbi:MAG: DUF2914 domain-containing protein [Deltaproteobacteria bacterium]|nr:DUF2914 domain-containing protein [Deltaproteobacteria bacterium]
MKRLILPLIFIALISLPTVVMGETGPSVEAAVIGTGVENLIPIGVAESFPSTTDRIYCYSKIINGEATTIAHRWYYGERTVAEVPLTIGSPSFRTYSYKTILPHHNGKWRVEIVSDAGNLLETLEFTVE